jgi:hypothetical protein
MEGMGKKSIRLLLFIPVVAFLAGMVTSERSWAQETEKSTPAKGEDGWRFLIAPYIWLTAIQGTAEGKRGNTADINLTVGDALSLINNVDFILGGRIEIEKGRWGFIFDGFGQHLSDSEDVLAIRDTKIPILVPPTVPVQGNVEITMELSIMQAALSYDVYR